MNHIFYWNDLPATDTAYILRQEDGMRLCKAPIDCWDKLSLAAQIEPDNSENWLILAMCCEEAGDQVAAVHNYLKFVRKAQNANSWLALGHYYSKIGRPLEAAGAYSKAARLEPDNGGAWFHLGNTLLKLKKHKQSVRALEKATALSPDNNMAWITLAQIYEVLQLAAKANGAWKQFASIPGRSC